MIRITLNAKSPIYSSTSEIKMSRHDPQPQSFPSRNEFAVGSISPLGSGFAFPGRISRRPRSSRSPGYRAPHERPLYLQAFPRPNKNGEQRQAQDPEEDESGGEGESLGPVPDGRREEASSEQKGDQHNQGNRDSP